MPDLIRVTCSTSLNMVIAATLLWNLSNDDQLSKPPLTHNAVVSLLKVINADQQRQLFEIWEVFLSGQRG